MNAAPADSPHPQHGTARLIPKRFPSLDGLRAIAVLAVFLYHYGAGATSANPFIHTIGLMARAGWAGVTLFFLLSGFLITGILWDSFEQPHRWRDFVMRRMLRIFPLYYGSLLLVVIAAVLRGELRSTLHLIWIPALFLQNVPALQGMEQGIHGLYLYHYWSLAVEEQFYLLWPLLLSLVKTRRQAIVLCGSVFALSLAFRISASIWVEGPSRFAGLLPSRAGELALGGWLAMAYRSPWWDKMSRALPLVSIVSGLVVLAMAWRAHSFQFEGRWGLSLGLCAMTLFLGAIVGWSLQPGLLQRLTSAAWLRWLGGISFGIYIFHVLLLPVYMAITFRLVGTDSRTMFLITKWVIGAVGTVTLAWLSFRFYESPFLRLKRRFTPHS